MSLHEDHATLSALIKGVDRQARQAETKWGVDRLPRLVDTDLLAKFERQRAKWRFALETAYDAKTITADMMEAAKSSSAAMERAWAALDQAASAAGHGELSPDVWEVPLAGGKVAAIVRTTAEAVVVTQAGRFVSVYTLDEVGHVIDALPSILTQAKVEFPGAVIVESRTTRADRSWIKTGDELPF